MAVYSTEFGAYVRGIVGTRSNREVSRLTAGAVSHTLVSEMKQGYVPNAEIVVAVALALAADPNQALDAAGKPSYIRYAHPELTRTGRVTRGRSARREPRAVAA